MGSHCIVLWRPGGHGGDGRVHCVSRWRAGRTWAPHHQGASRGRGGCWGQGRAPRAGWRPAGAAGARARGFAMAAKSGTTGLMFGGGLGSRFGGVMDVALHSFLAPPKRWLISALAHVKRVVCLHPTTPSCREREREQAQLHRSQTPAATPAAAAVACLAHPRIHHMTRRPAKPLTPFARGQTLRLERPRRRSPPIPISPRLAPASPHPRNTLFPTRRAVLDAF